MSYKLKNLKKVENNKLFMELEVTNNYLKKSMNKAYKDISQKAKIPGFRKGRIPYNIIDINFGKDYVLNEAANLAISELYPQIIEESKIKPIDYPKIKFGDISDDAPLGIEITVEVEPEIKPPAYKGIEVATTISEEVFDDEVEKQIENLKNNYATLEAVEEDRPAVKGDFVIIDFTGKIEGNDFEGGSSEDFTLEIGSKTLFEEFENALEGMKKGEEKNTSLNLPQNIQNQEIAGKKADFAITLKEIKKKVLPDTDENFLANFGDYKSVDEFKSFIAERISQQKKRARREEILSKIMDRLVEAAKFEVPEPMIKNRIEHYEKDFEKELSNHKLSRSDYLKTINLDESQFNENIRKSALREVKEYLIINSLEKAESANIKPSDDQVSQETEKILDAYKKEEEKKKLEEYIKSEPGAEELKNSLRRRNLFDLLIKNARVKGESSQNKEGSLQRKLWTPASKNQGNTADKPAEKKLWVPDSSKNKESDGKDDESGK